MLRAKDLQKIYTLGLCSLHTIYGVLIVFLTVLNLFAWFKICNITPLPYDSQSHHNERRTGFPIPILNKHVHKAIIIYRVYRRLFTFYEIYNRNFSKEFLICINFTMENFSQLITYCIYSCASDNFAHGHMV